MARPRRAPHLRGAGPDRPGLRRAVRVRGDPGHRRRADRAGPPPRLFEHARPPRRRPRDDDQRRAAPRARRTTSPPPGSGASTSRSTRSAATRSSRSPAATSSTASSPAIDAALDAGLDPVKVNCVVIRGVNDDEVVDLAAFGRAKGVGVRFIEFMPLDAEGDVVDGPGRPRRGDPRSRSTPCSRSSRRGAPADTPSPPTRYRYRGRRRRRRRDPERHRAVLRRLRPRAHHRRGQVPHLPVRARGVLDLRAMLRDGGVRSTTLAAEIERAVGTKWAGHRIGQVNFVRPARSMSQIGG